MTILDGFLLFDNNAAITAGGASGNTIDLLNARDIAIGFPLLVHCRPTEAFAATGAGTLQVQFQGSPDNSVWTTYAESGVIGKADLAIGGRPFDIHVPRFPSGAAIPRYLRLNYLVGTGPFTAGKLTAGIILDRHDYVAYPPGLVISN